MEQRQGLDMVMDSLHILVEELAGHMELDMVLSCMEMELASLDSLVAALDNLELVGIHMNLLDDHQELLHPLDFPDYIDLDTFIMGKSDMKNLSSEERFFLRVHLRPYNSTKIYSINISMNILLLDVFSTDIHGETLIL